MTVDLQKLFWFSAWLVLLGQPAGLHAELRPEKLYQKVLPSVMTLEVENQTGERFVGSAVLALADDIALTAWHVVADARSVCAYFSDGQCVRVIGCIDRDGPHDLALLKLEKPLPHRQAVLCRELQSVAARAYVIGAPKGYDFSISDGLISQIRRVDGFPQYQVSCPISPGNSGGPILNGRGEVIGITSWTKADAQNVSFAIPTRELLRLNVSGRATTWEQLAAKAAPVLPARLVESRHVASKWMKEEPVWGSLEGLKQRLNGSIGKPVTVVVEEGSRTNTFNFTVPLRGLE